jgi:hypothetical protein
MDSLADRLIEQLRADGQFVAADTFTDPKGVAHILGRTTRTLANWRDLNTGPQWVKTYRVLYRIDLLADWLQSGGKTMKSPPIP